MKLRSGRNEPSHAEQKRGRNERLIIHNNDSQLIINEKMYHICYYLMIMSYYGKIANLEVGMYNVMKKSQACSKKPLVSSSLSCQKQETDRSVGPFVNRRKQERSFGLWWREVATLPNEETTKGWRRDVRWLKLSSIVTILMPCKL